MLVLYQRKDNQRRVQLDRSKQRKERVKLLLARCTDPDKENSNPDIHILLHGGGGKKASSFRETGGTHMLCTLSNLRESSGQVSGSTPLLSKYCPVVTEVKTGKPIH